MPEFFPDVLAQISYASLTDGFPSTPPILQHSFAEDWQRDSGSSVAGGHFDKSRSTYEGHHVVVPQDTTLDTGKNTGRILTAISGGSNFKDDLVDPKTGKYCLLQQNETLDTTWELRDAASNAGLRHAQIELLRGFPAIDSSTHDRANTYVYIELCYGSTDGNYRLAFEWGEKYRLEYSHPQIDSGAWREVQRATDVFDHSGGALTILVQPDSKTGTLKVTINKNNVLSHARDRAAAPEVPSGNPYASASLPSTEKYMITGKNCFHTIAINKVRYRSITARPNSKSYKIPIQASTAKVASNTMSREADGQANAHSVTQTEGGSLKIESTATLPDAGEGKGSAEPPRFSDILIYVPAQWMFFAGTAPVQGLRIVKVHETQVWDDARRYGYSHGRAIIQNYDGRHRGAFGHYSLNIVASNGYRSAQRFRGLMGVGPDGHSITAWGTGSVVSSAFHDNSYKLMSPLCYELVLDGLCIFTAIRILLEAGSIHASFLQDIPRVGFPPYNDGMPYPILAMGTGNSPRHKYTPEWTPLDVILDIIRTYGEVTSGIVPGDFRSTPYYFYQDVFGNFHCKPYNAANLPPVKEYSTQPPSGYDPNLYGLIEDDVAATTDVTNLRTEINIQGLDPWNNNLLNYHRQLYQNRDIVGYRSALLDRDPRYVSDAAMARAARTHAFISSLPVQYVRFRTAFDPLVHAGQNIIVEDYRTLGRRGIFTITQLDNEYGLSDASQMRGEIACHSTITARSAESGIVP